MGYDVHVVANTKGLGGQVEEDKWLDLNGFRVILLVSESENFGNVIIEALSQGTPVIASCGTPWAEIEKKNAGF